MHTVIMEADNTSLSIAIIYLFAFVFIDIFIILANALPLKKFPFQCIGEYVTQVCIFPEQYCDDDHNECRPCSQDICDKQEQDHFPLQCSYNCSQRALGPIEDQSSTPFIYDNALIWFIIALVPLVILIVGLATFPIWKPYLKNKWLEEKCRRSSSIPATEENPLVTQTNDNTLPGENNDEDTSEEEEEEEEEGDDDEEGDYDNDDDDDGITDNRNSASIEGNHDTNEYCEKLKNVNPKDPSDGLSKIATTRSCLSEEIFENQLQPEH